jgi:hypothetical protein
VLGPVAASSRIGPAGGQLVAPDYSLTISVPPGAFDREQLVTLQPIESHAPGAQGPAWRISPEGVTAAKPITLAWRPEAARRLGLQGLRIASQGADGVWRSRAATEDDEGIVRVSTTHFSDWSLVAGAQLRPAQTEVPLGGAAEFTVRLCSRGSDAKDAGQQVHYPCSDDAVAALATSGWAVNGTPMGNASVGQLSGGDTIMKSARRYQAPAALPAQNPVAVSVSYRDPFEPQTATQQLVAHATVVDPNAGCDWVRTVQAMDMTVEQDYQWAGSDDHESASYSHQGRVSGRLVQEPLSLIGQVWFSGSLDQGSVKAEHHQSSRIVKRIIDVKGEGKPLAYPAQPLVRVFVDLASCQLIISATHLVGAEHWSYTNDGTARLPSDKTGMSFGVTGFPLGGLRRWSQERLFPVWQSYAPADGQRAAIDEGAHHDFGFQTGSSRVRWTLTPR